MHDVALAEDLAQDALVAALTAWPQSGVPDNPAAWLTSTATNRAIDQLRRRQNLDRKHELVRTELERADPRGPTTSWPPWTTSTTTSCASSSPAATRSSARRRRRR
nr:sigma factor [Conexibacter sp. W3-3-2]